jgi:hypothetical protein
MNKTEKDQLLYKVAKAILEYAKLQGGLESFITNGCLLPSVSPNSMSVNSEMKIRVQFNCCLPTIDFNLN